MGVGIGRGGARGSFGVWKMWGRRWWWCCDALGERPVPGTGHGLEWSGVSDQARDVFERTHTEALHAEAPAV